jgi:hypothetical protein
LIPHGIHHLAILSGKKDNSNVNIGFLIYGVQHLKKDTGRA